MLEGICDAIDDAFAVGADAAALLMLELHFHVHETALDPLAHAGVMSYTLDVQESGQRRLNLLVDVEKLVLVGIDWTWQ